ncbi:MAG: pantetheine-phosphate adenylyltransferase [Micropruina sp.]
MRAICPGSFDPVTHGHLDIIARAERLFGEVIVGVGKNSAKNYLFSPDERIDMLAEATAGMPGVRVLALEGLLVDFCARHGVGVIVKGLRFASDFDFELQMAHMNRALTSVETVMLPSAAQWATISSTMIREVASYGGDVSQFVPPSVAERIRSTIAQRAEGATEHA